MSSEAHHVFCYQPAAAAAFAAQQQQYWQQMASWWMAGCMPYVPGSFGQPCMPVPGAMAIPGAMGVSSIAR